MNRVFRQIGRGTLFAAMFFATVSLFTSCSKDDDGVGVALTYSLSGNASASQTVPSGSGNGSGTFNGTYNASTKVMTYTVTWANLTGAPIAGGLFTGASGQAGSSIALWTLGSGIGASGSLSTSTTLNAEQEANLLAGKAYYLFSTAANTSGEIRGQITASAE